MASDVWEEFEARCLVPMENIEAPLTADLETETTAEQDGRMATTYVMDATNSDTLFFVITEEGGKLVCGMMNVAIGQTPNSTVQDLVASGRYALVGRKEGEAYIFRSETWREPVLEVELRSDGERVTWIVRDTELEG